MSQDPKTLPPSQGAEDPPPYVFPTERQHGTDPHDPAQPEHDPDVEPGIDQQRAPI